MTFPHILTPDTLTVFLGGDTLVVDRTVTNWDAIKEALQGDDEALLRRLISPRIAVEDAVAEATADPEAPKVNIEIRGGKVYFDGYVVDNELTRRMLDVLSEGMPLDSWIKFAQNLYQNPLVSAREEIFLFLAACDLPITPDGHFLAYKKVRNDYLDSFSGSIDNSPGRVVEMPRDEVDTNRHNTCSRGLHFCSKSYLPSFGIGGASRVVVVKINPADVVSIPSDYSNSKGRTWRYVVVGEIGEDQARQQTWRPVDSFGEDDEDETGATSRPADADDEIPEGMEECGYCGGTGLLSETIEVDNMDPEEIGGENDECSQCGGEGYVPDEDGEDEETDEDEEVNDTTIHDPGPFGWQPPIRPID